MNDNHTKSLVQTVLRVFLWVCIACVFVKNILPDSTRIDVTENTASTTRLVYERTGTSAISAEPERADPETTIPSAAEAEVPPLPEEAAVTTPVTLQSSVKEPEQTPAATVPAAAENLSEIAGTESAPAQTEPAIAETSPVVAETNPAAAGTKPAAGGEAKADKPQQTTTQTAPAAPGLININTAGKAELMELDGIGEVKAQAIIDYRETYGDFVTIEELVFVKGIGEKTLEKNRSKICV